MKLLSLSHWSVVAAGSLLLACSAYHTAADENDKSQHDAATANATLGDAQTTSQVDASPAATGAGVSVLDAASACGEAGCAVRADAGPSNLDAGISALPQGALDAGSDAQSEAGATLDAGMEDMCTPFPRFNRSCATKADCSIGSRSQNCCGTTLATGIRSSEADAYRAAVTKCNAGKSVCDCIAGPMRADDGSTAVGLQPHLECIAGQCWTSYLSLTERTPCGITGYTCDLNSELCVITTSPNGDATTRCVRLPTHCDRDRSCACDPSLCSGSTTCAQLTPPNTLMCHCNDCL